MKVLIVDDEELARLRLIRLIEQIPACNVVGEAENGEHALELIEQLEPELVFLDVRMPGMDGISVAKALAEFNEPPAVVFCTAFDEYALEAFGTLAQGYIVKPVQLKQLEEVIEKCQKRTRLHSLIADNKENAAQAQRQHISAKTRQGIELIPLTSVLCFIADHKYVTVVHEAGESLIDETLKDLEQEFSERFLRVHRNSLVAVTRIAALERDSSGGHTLRLKGGEFRPAVSRRHVSKLREILSRL